MERKIGLDVFLDSVYAKVGNRFEKKQLLDFQTAELLLSDGIITSLDFLVLTGKKSPEEASCMLPFEPYSH